MKGDKSVEIIDLLKRTLYKNSEARLSAHDALFHKWVVARGRDPFEH